MDSTRVFVDSINAVVKFSSELPVLRQECSTNWEDVVIVAIVSVSAIIIVAICVFGYKCIKKQEINARKQSDKDKRDWEIEDKKEKRRLVQKDMKLQFLKELCYEDIETCGEEKVSETNKNTGEKTESEPNKVKELETESVQKKESKKIEKRLKAHDSVEVKMYIAELEKNE